MCVVTETGVETTYGELISSSLSFASGFQTVAGLYPGSTVLIFSPNISLYPTLLFAAEAAGITATTANSGYTAEEMGHQLMDCGASVILVGSDLVDVARDACKLAGFNEDRVYVLPGTDGKVNTKGLKSYELLRGKKDFKPVKIPEKDLATRIACEYTYLSNATSSKEKVTDSVL